MAIYGVLLRFDGTFNFNDEAGILFNTTEAARSVSQAAVVRRQEQPGCLRITALIIIAALLLVPIHLI